MYLWYGKVFLECEEEIVLSNVACSSHRDMFPFLPLSKRMILSIQATPFFGGEGTEGVFKHQMRNASDTMATLMRDRIICLTSKEFLWDQVF